MTTFLKWLASWLSVAQQQELKRLHFARLIRRGLFIAAEDHDKEFGRLQEWVGSGDWVLDIGANVGNYSARMSELVGPAGRVFAFEPVPQTFELLVANMSRLGVGNVTLLNVAVSQEFAIRGMGIPNMKGGIANPYMAHLTDDPEAGFTVVCMAVDSLPFSDRVTLAKVDVEGHELSALMGMRRLLERDRPVLIIEGRSAEVESYLAGLGYGCEETARSPNRVFRATRSA